MFISALRQKTAEVQSVDHWFIWYILCLFILLVRGNILIRGLFMEKLKEPEIVNDPQQ